MPETTLDTAPRCGTLHLMDPKKAPPAVAIVMPTKPAESEQEEMGADLPGVELTKEFLGDEHFKVLKPGSTGEIKLRFKVLDADDGVATVEFTSADDVDTEEMLEAGGLGDDEPEPEMRDKFKKFKKEKPSEEEDGVY